MPLWIYFILTRDSSIKSFMFLSPRQTHCLCSENEGFWTLWWAHWGDPVSDPEELLRWANTQYNQTWDGEPNSQSWLTVPCEVVAAEKSFWKTTVPYGVCSQHKVNFSDSEDVSDFLDHKYRVKHTDRLQWKSLLWHEQTQLKVTSASPPNLQCIMRTHSCWSVHSKASSLPQSQIQPTIRPWGLFKTQSRHTFFFLNIVKSNTSPSCTHSNCQTVLDIFPLLILLVDGSEERKTKNIKGFLLKCKWLSTFSFISHFRTTIDLIHFCLCMSSSVIMWSFRLS